MVHPFRLTPRPLSRSAFQPFGDVVSIDESASGRAINQQTSQRFDDLVRLDLLRNQGAPRASLVRAIPVPLPVRLRLMERHPLGSQLFLPLGLAPFLVVVAQGKPLSPDGLRAFVTDGRQGVNYRAGVWHHPLTAIGQQTDFLIVDRSPETDNYEEVLFDPSSPIEVVLDRADAG